MTRPEVHLPIEQAYVRDVLFGVELLDAVTLARVSDGVKVVAEGLHGKPIVSASGFFVWLGKDLTPLRKVTIDPGLLPYERVERDPSELTLPLTVVELPPRADHPFADGVTGMRGTLIEDRVGRVPVGGAAVHLRWLDENSVWHDAPAPSHTGDGGDFVAVLRLTAQEVPELDANDQLTVRLRARRGAAERESTDLKLPRGHVADPSAFPPGTNPLLFVWDELQP
jgi:hypothetical protein